ncbi:hypothetical protein [Thalassospira lucentensis]|uniref:Uncharacterized protein n=1 Tax=Thalassospira lucentensis TaxID=168935 RepID=A0A358HMZ8_9PROT|nr:hypothetical protein [Thalassospira lucentensis]HBU96566.1 hypothetical protein [Thalassospira lucentensis]HCW65890.1 hypothetical protein [Thalassospira lucentensis]|tara:strand:+ start:1854 stop:2465 length:612 start_codon:yes stop_codon:yes gene_type:complete
MNSLLGLGFGLPVKSANTEISKDGGNEGIGRYGAFSVTPQSSTSAQPTLSGTKFNDLSDSMQAVMLEMQAAGSGSASFADAMANVVEQGSDAKSNANGNGLNEASAKDGSGNLLGAPSPEDDFEKSLEEALKQPSKIDSKEQKADREQAKAEARQYSDNQIDAGLSDPDMQSSVAGLDSRVSTQVMASARQRSVNAMTESLAA